MKPEDCKVGARVKGSKEAIDRGYFRPGFSSKIASVGELYGNAIIRLENGSLWHSHWLELVVPIAPEEILEATLKALPPYEEPIGTNTGVIVERLLGGGVRVTSKEYREAVYGNSYQGSYLYELFKHMADEHKVILLESELQEIIDLVHKRFPDPDLQKAVSEVYREAEFCVRSCAPTPFPGWVMNKLSPFVHDDP